MVICFLVRQTKEAPVISPPDDHINAEKIGSNNMKKSIIRISCVLFAAVALAGCQSADQKDSKVNIPTRVDILFSPPNRPFTIVGNVAANRPHQDPRFGYDSSQTWQDKLQRQAAAQGADAVIVNNASVNNINSILVTGVSIRFKREAAPPKP